MRISHTSFNQQHFDTAYHTLAAALHLAAEQKNMLGLKEVESVAIDQIGWLDQNAPEYHHSTRNAAIRGNDSIYEMLARQARAKQALLAEKMRREAPGARGGE